MFTKVRIITIAILVCSILFILYDGLINGNLVTTVFSFRLFLFLSLTTILNVKKPIFYYILLGICGICILGLLFYDTRNPTYSPFIFTSSIIYTLNLPSYIGGPISSIPFLIYILLFFSAFLKSCKNFYGIKLR
jgi:hypothetical protein